jgi:hypothetical protein
MYSSRNRRYRIRRVRLWILAWFFGTAALLVGGLVINQVVNPGPPAPAEMPISVPTPTWGDTSSPSPSAAPTASPKTKNSSSALTGPVQVVQGKRQVNGIELGFPHSTAGAVSAAYADTTEVLSTLDPDRAAAVMRLVADPSWTGAPQQAAEGAVNDRKDLGLPAAGPVLDGTSVQTEPVEYQVRNAMPGTVLVLLLCDGVFTTPAQGTTTQVGVFPFQMHWTGGDWKVQSIPASDAYLKLAAEPDSPQSAASGWQQLQAAGA